MELFAFKQFVFTCTPRGLFSGETRLRLQPLDLAVLNVLLDQYPAAVNRADIWEEVWGLHSDANEENIEKHVSTIRKAIGKDCIETIATIGYRFAVPTRRITGARARQILCKDTPAAGVLALPKESVYAPTGSTTPRIKELVRKHKRLLLSDRLLTSEFRILSFRTEWQPIVGWSPELRQTVKTLLTVRQKRIDRRDDISAK